MIRHDPLEQIDDDRRVPDRELVVAAVLVGAVVLLASILVPLIG